MAIRSLSEAGHLFLPRRVLGKSIGLAGLTVFAALMAVLVFSLGPKAAALPVAVFIAALMFFDPEIALMVTVISTASGYLFTPGSQTASLTLSAPKILGILTLLSLLLHRMARREKLYLGSRIYVPALYILMSAVAMVLSPSSSASTSTLVQLLGSFMLYFLAVNILRSERSLHKLLVVLTAVYTLVSLYSIAQYFILPTTWVDEFAAQEGGAYQAFVDRGIKRSSGFSHPGVFSFILNILIPYVIYFCYSARTVSLRALYFFCLAAMLGALLLTHTRAAVLALLVGLCILVLKRQIRFSFPKWLTIVAAGTVCLLLFMPKTFFTRVVDITSYSREGSVRIRIENQENAIRFFLENIAFGIGLGNFDELNPVDRPVNREATNMLVEIAAETGTAGLSFMVLFLALLLRDSARLERLQARRPTNLGSFIMVGVLVSIVSSLFMSNQDFKEWWLFMAFPFAALRAEERGRQSPGGALTHQLEGGNEQ